MDAPPLCEHLQQVADYLVATGRKITFTGQAWSHNCRMWIYFDCVLDTDDLTDRFSLKPPVAIHVNDDSHSGLERGFVCNEHQDAVIGLYKPTHET